jgi:4-amino-4-deoxy-L-arabinose transferase-like glycosyltransferase
MSPGHLVTLSLLPLCGFLFFYRLGDRDLTSSHEARAAQDAHTILETGNWGLPRLFDDKPELQKPPLYYWLVALSAKLCGGPVDACTVRLPAAVAATGTVCMVYLLGWFVGPPRAGFLGALMLATSMHFTWMARVGRIDMPLTFAVAVALVAFSIGKERVGRGAWRWFLLTYVGVAIGMLLKGPIAILLPGVVVAATFVLERQRTSGTFLSRALRAIHDFGLWWGIPLMLAIAGPWFVWANARTSGELFRVFFWYHNVQRGLGGADALQAHPWWFYLPRLAIDLAPWSVLVPLVAWAMWRNAGYRGDPLARFGAVWFLTMTVLLSCMRFKRADYLLPAYPGAVLMVASVADRWWQRATSHAGWQGRLRSASRWALPVILVAYLGSWWIYVDRIVPAQDAEHAYPRFAAEIRRRTSEIIVFFRTEAHNLAFHLGRPLTSLLEWENLDWWVGRPESVFVIMPPECVAEWRQHLTRGQLEIVLCSTDFGGASGERPLVLVRTRSLGETAVTMK